MFNCPKKAKHVNELARAVGVAPSSATAFFKAAFKGYSKYRVLCNNSHRLAAALKLLNGEYQPHDLYNARTPDEVDRANDE